MATTTSGNGAPSRPLNSVWFSPPIPRAILECQILDAMLCHLLWHHPLMTRCGECHMYADPDSKSGLGCSHEERPRALVTVASPLFGHKTHWMKKYMIINISANDHSEQNNTVIVSISKVGRQLTTRSRDHQILASELSHQYKEPGMVT